MKNGWVNLKIIKLSYNDAKKNKFILERMRWQTQKLKAIWMWLDHILYYNILIPYVCLSVCLSVWPFIDSAPEHDTDMRPVSLEQV
jgi:hypothetical protein